MSRLFVAGVRVRSRGGRRLLIARRCTVAVSAGPSGRPEPALRVEQEDTCCDDLLAFFQAVPNLDAVGELDADRDGARLEAIPRGDEHVLLHAGVNHRITRHGDDVLTRG